MSDLPNKYLFQKSRSSNSSKLAISGPLFTYGGFYGAIFYAGFGGSTLVGTMGFLMFLMLSSSDSSGIE